MAVLVLGKTETAKDYFSEAGLKTKYQEVRELFNIACDISRHNLDCNSTVMFFVVSGKIDIIVNQAVGFIKECGLNIDIDNVRYVNNAGYLDIHLGRQCSDVNSLQSCIDKLGFDFNIIEYSTFYNILDNLSADIKYTEFIVDDSTGEFIKFGLKNVSNVFRALGVMTSLNYTYEGDSKYKVTCTVTIADKDALSNTMFKAGYII